MRGIEDANYRVKLKFKNSKRCEVRFNLLTCAHAPP
jgi:hypothetical protein